MSTVAGTLTRALAAGLGLPAGHFDPIFAGEPHWFGKVIRYVGPAHGEELAPDAQGVGPHADRGFLTLLLQDPHGPVAGLQARPPGSESVDVPPEGDSLVVNVGEMLEVATDGYLVATPHRVLACGPGATRQSVGFFWSPRLDARLDPVLLPAEPSARPRGARDGAEGAAPDVRRQRTQGLGPVPSRGGRPAPRPPGRGRARRRHRRIGPVSRSSPAVADPLTTR